MHASSYIRYLKMSKSCKIDTNSSSALGFPGPSDRREEKLNKVAEFPRAPLAAPMFISRLDVLTKPGRDLVGFASCEEGTLATYLPCTLAALGAWMLQTGDQSRPGSQGKSALVVSPG